MCAIIGINGEDAELNRIVVEQLLIQSQIRGKHATGISYVEKNDIKTISKSISAEIFVRQELPISSMYIGHCRYSTSDIKYNQPISYEDISIVHNGVISQEDFIKWEQHYNEKNFKTKNDTELLLKCIDKNKNPFLKFKNASIACGVLYKDKIVFMRNNTRPLWIFKNDYFVGFASTKDIIVRTFENLEIDVDIESTLPFKEYTIQKFKLQSKLIEHDNNILFSKDQQQSSKTFQKYL